jgi:TolB-like protein
LRFGGYALDVDGFVLTDEQGAEIRLTRGEFVLLSEFLRHPERVFSRDHLSNLLSGHGCESYERGIDMHIVRLRRKIEPDPKHPSVILTVPGFGYKLLVKSNVNSPSPVTSGTALEVPLIGVLPFSGLGGDASQAYTAGALSEEIATILATFPSVRVIVATHRAEGADSEIRCFGRAVGARYVLGGSVTRDGARLRVLAQLMDPASGEQVWARRYDEDCSDAAAAHSYIAESISNSVTGAEGVVKNEEGRRAWHKPPSELTEYDYFARGEVLRYRQNRQDYSLVREAWREGLKRFPDSAMLRTMLAQSYLNEVETFVSRDPRGDIERAWDLATEADATAGMSPWSAMVHSWLMTELCQWHEEDFERSVACASLAVRRAPYHARMRYHLSWFLANAGRIDQAIEWARWANRHYPRPGFACHVAWAYYLAGRYEEALAALEEFGTEYIPQLAVVCVRVARVAEARGAIAAWLKSFPDVSVARLALEPIREPWKQRWLDDLRIAGLPET